MIPDIARAKSSRDPCACSDHIVAHASGRTWTWAAVAPDLSPAQMPVVEGFGEALPMACDETAIGRQLNRRVELWVVPDFSPTGTPPVLAPAP